MFKVYDLDRRPRVLTTESKRIATQYWVAITDTGGTPICEEKKDGVTARISLQPVEDFDAFDWVVLLNAHMIDQIRNNQRRNGGEQS